MTIKSVQAPLECTGYHQMAAGDLTTAAVIPGTGSVVMIQAEAQNVRYRLDNVAPTAAVGVLLAAGETHTLNMGQGKISDIKAIEAAVGGILNIHCFK